MARPQISDEQLREVIASSVDAETLVNSSAFTALSAELVSAAERELMGCDLTGINGGANAIAAVLRWRSAQYIVSAPAERVEQSKVAMVELERRNRIESGRTERKPK